MRPHRRTLGLVGAFLASLVLWALLLVLVGR
jgi:hypothetical protein